MKTILYLLLVTFTSSAAMAQTDSLPIYRQFPDVPPFSIARVPDSSTFAKADLRKRKATIIMLFSPDCEHCQHETRELEANIDSFKNVQIIMISFLNYDLVKNFYQDYHIGDYPNIVMGRDSKFFLGTFYKIKNYPSIFMYDKKGKLTKNFEGSVPISKLTEAL